jgi:hypothetical protein
METGGSITMKMQAAMDVMHNKPEGFRVAFEWCGDGFLRSDHFPEEREPLIPTEAEAWELAERFARAARGRVCNLYVVDHDYNPVPGYQAREIKNR